MARLTQDQLLELEFDCDDLGRKLTIAEYLKTLLLTLWQEGEGFSGKRPFGNSGWEFDLYRTLVKAGAIDGEIRIDEGHEELWRVDSAAGAELVRKLIVRVFRNARLLPSIKRGALEVGGL